MQKRGASKKIAISDSYSECREGLLDGEEGKRCVERQRTQLINPKTSRQRSCLLLANGWYPCCSIDVGLHDKYVLRNPGTDVTDTSMRQDEFLHCFHVGGSSRTSSDCLFSSYQQHGTCASRSSRLECSLVLTPTSNKTMIMIGTIVTAKGNLFGSCNSFPILRTLFIS